MRTLPAVHNLVIDKCSPHLSDIALQCLNKLKILFEQFPDNIKNKKQMSNYWLFKIQDRFVKSAINLKKNRSKRYINTTWLSIILYISKHLNSYFIASRNPDFIWFAFSYMYVVQESIFQVSLHRNPRVARNHVRKKMGWWFIFFIKMFLISN